MTTRETLKSTAFTVADVRRQETPWNTGGIMGWDLPSGWFVVLDPSLPALSSDHCAVGLVFVLLTAAEAPVKVEYRTWRRQEDGRLCFFFSDDAFKAMKVGDRIDLAEA